MPETVSVEHGPRTDLAVMLAIWPTLAGLFVAAYFGLGQTRYYGLELAETVVGFYILAAILIVLADYPHVIETVTMTPETISFPSRRFRASITTFSWDRIDPLPRGLVTLGSLTFRVRDEDGRGWRRFTVSPQQARAILTYPSFPKTPLPARTKRQLRLPQD
jgi:hypothetical protein